MPYGLLSMPRGGKMVCFMWIYFVDAWAVEIFFSVFSGFQTNGQGS